MAAAAAAQLKAGGRAAAALHIGLSAHSAGNGRRKAQLAAAGWRWQLIIMQPRSSILGGGGGGGGEAEGRRRRRLVWVLGRGRQVEGRHCCRRTSDGEAWPMMMMT